MGYWVATDLAQYLPQPVIGSYLVTASSFPVNASQFQEIVNEVSAEFDMAAAKAGFITPIPTTAAAAYLAVKAIVRDGATADLLRIIYTGPNSKYADSYQAAFDKAMAAISAGDLPLPGAPPDPAADGRLLPIYSGIASTVLNPSMGYPRDLAVPNDF